MYVYATAHVNMYANARRKMARDFVDSLSVTRRGFEDELKKPTNEGIFLDNENLPFQSTALVFIINMSS